MSGLWFDIDDDDVELYEQEDVAQGVDSPVDSWDEEDELDAVNCMGGYDLD